ncbi:nuclear transport factor 2 family protein [Alkalinema sp. FACHB-956]|uniref:nuclear transport factor 2 family protein n=1 Tax=Alkalinema sp. FACHB-956 TaxID=2692768 RepID=UPI001F54FDD2|nr:nuclear transport factor 2 family protein [Alkalinema sp. FACHB-956]
MVDSPTPIAVAEMAFQQFSQGLATGEWQGFLAMLTEDFTFWFPIGAFQGENVGKARAAEFFQLVSQVFSPGLTLTIERMTYRTTPDGATVVFEVRSTGSMLGHPYSNQAAISFDVRGQQICGYREYLGVLYQLPTS